MITILEIPHRLPPKAYQFKDTGTLIDLAAADLNSSWITRDKQLFLDCWGDDAPEEALELFKTHDRIVELYSGGETSYIPESLFDELETAKEILFDDLQTVFILETGKDLVDFYTKGIHETPYRYLKHKLDEFISVHLYTHNHNGSISVYAEIVDNDFFVQDWKADHDASCGYLSFGVLSLEEVRDRLELAGEDGGFSPAEKEQVMFALDLS